MLVRRILTCAIALAMSSVAMAAGASSSAMPIAEPTGMPSTPSTSPRHDQVITVRATAKSSTTATLEAWKRDATGSYDRVFGPIRVYLGIEGVGVASEYRSRTPRGVFTLTDAFGRLPDPGTSLPYRQVGYSDWWVSDVDSPLYNTLQTCAAGRCSFSTAASEQLGAISLYDYAFVIDYNRRPVVPGAGSAFFVHIDGGEPTAGCISLSRASVVRLLRWLNPAHDPIISIGVGDKAYAPID